jgi:protein TonB
MLPALDLHVRPRPSQAAGPEALTLSPSATAPPAVRPGALMHLDRVDQRPVTLTRTKPTYPPAAIQMRREGEFEMRVLVNETGRVEAVEILTGPAKSDLAREAMKAARSWTYSPAVADGVPVKVWVVEKIAFKL